MPFAQSPRSLRALSLLLSLGAAGCPGRGGSPDQNLDAQLAPDASDASADAPTTDGAPPVDGAMTDPPGTPLAAVHVSDLELRALTNGGFELASGSRVLLASNFGPVAAQRYTQSPSGLPGFWTFVRRSQTETRPSANATATVDGDALVLTTQADGHTATLRFRRANADEVEVRAHVQAPTAFQSTALRFRCDANAHFLGFGEQYNDTDHRGRRFSLFVSEQGLGRDPTMQSLVSGSHESTYFPLPFFLDPRGFGLAVDTSARTLVDLCSTRADEYSLAPEQPEEVLLHLYTGPTPADVLRAWTANLQGRSEAPPAWAVQGVWLGVQGGPASVRSVVAQAQAANIPVTAVWAQDWLGRKDLGLGNIDIRYHWTLDSTWYPDFAGLTAELHAEHVHFLGYFNPFVLRDEDQFDQGNTMGFLLRGADGMASTVGLPHGDAAQVDLSNLAAVQWFQGYAGRAIDLGQDGWMQDYGEWQPLDCVPSNGADPMRAHNHYPVEWTRAAHDLLRARRPDGDYVLFSRSGHLGTAGVAQVMWAGDQEVSWGVDDGLPTVVPALLSLGLSGISYVTADIGGYYGGPSTRELYLRWIELGAFMPVMRTHEGLRRDENWSWNHDADTLAFFSRFARIHAALAPRIIALGTNHAATGMPILRSLALQFPDDPAGYALTDEFLLGDDLLVAPVVVQGATTRSVYFPRGSWYSVWDPTVRVDGPVRMNVPAPLGQPPVFSSVPRTDLNAIH